MLSKHTHAMPPGQAGDETVCYRSGVAARLAGLPVETLRVWERRYGLCDAQRSIHGQRLYSADQVYRLGLLKRLVDAGHAIGSVAQLSNDKLHELTGGNQATAALLPGSIKTVVIGISLARQLVAAVHEGLEIEVQASCRGLDQMARLPRDIETDILLVELSELDQSLMPALAAARAAVRASVVVVLYRFSSSATIRVLRKRGWLVARVPSEMGELLPLCRAALLGQRLGDLPSRADPGPRRFDDDMLAQLGALSGKLACECPRHLADLLLTVGSFERYSLGCASQDQADSQLHGMLAHAAARSRSILEEAMEHLMRAEDISLPLVPAARDPGT